MKKFLFGMLGASLALTSCSTDEPIGNLPDGTSVDVTFTTVLPQSLATRAYGDGTTAKELFYAVYDKDGNFLFEDTDQFPATSLHKDVSIQLVTGETYQIVFWAQNADAPYSFNAAQGTMTATYATDNNAETLDAFYVAKTITVQANELNQEAELKRPFCQVNIATADKDAAEKAGITFPTQSAVTFSEVPNQLNLLDGTVEGETEVTFSSAAIPTGSITVAENEYDYLSMTYFLASTDGEVQTSVKMEVNNLTDGVRTYANIPVRRNYKTNIVGNLLTSTTLWDVYINPIFDDPSYDILVPWDGKATQPVTPVVTDTQMLYQVGSPAELAWTATQNLKAEAGKEVVIQLTADIDLAMQEWPGFGDTSRSLPLKPFTGTLDGNGHTIYNLADDGTTDGYCSGLVHVARNATIKNVNIKGGKVNHTEDTAGAIVGTMLGNTTVENCSVEGVIVTSGDAAAGVAGRAYGTTNVISNCSFSGSVSGTKAGGICAIASANNATTTITNCTNTGSVNAGKAGAGGILGYAGGGSLNIKDCRNSGAIGAQADSQNLYSAGIVGYLQNNQNNGTDVESCANTGAIKGVNAAGIIGNNGSYRFVTVKGCTNSGSIVGVNQAGGIGTGGFYNYYNCSNTASVSATATGGFAGGIAAVATVLNDEGKNIMMNNSGGKAAITATYAGRLFGSTGLNQTVGATYMALTIDDSNGDDYTNLPTIGSMPFGTVQANVMIEAGTLHGNPAHSTKASAKMIINEGAAWDIFPGQTGTWTRTYANPNWVKAN